MIGDDELDFEHLYTQREDFNSNLRQLDKYFPPLSLKPGSINCLPPLAPKQETVNHPSHYNEHPAGVECIDIVEQMSFNVGNAMKYLWRAGLKSPDAIEDLEKAAWYCNREIERLK